MCGKAWELGKESVTSFINDGALSRGAAIAFYTVSSIGPVLLVVVAIAGLAPSVPMMMRQTPAGSLPLGA